MSTLDRLGKVLGGSAVLGFLLATLPLVVSGCSEGSTGSATSNPAPPAVTSDTDKDLPKGVVGPKGKRVMP